MNRIKRLLIIPLAAACIARGDDRLPAGTAPVNGQKVAGFRMEATGWAPRGSFGFFAVEPLAVSPQTWIQPRIHSAADDGTVTGWINFGTEDNGAGETFLVYLLACDRKNPFGEAKVIHVIPDGCLVSPAVKVLRVK